MNLANKRNFLITFLSIVGLSLLILGLTIPGEEIFSKKVWVPFKTQVQKEVSSSAEITSIKPQSVLNTVKPSLKTSATPNPTPINEAKIETTNSNPASTSQPAAQQYTVKVSISDGGSFEIKVEAGSNQCDVLSKAQNIGKISGLLMKYNDSLGTNGVYKINDKGSEDQVWWVYTVNGKSPPKGCSLINVSDGDDVKWSYIGS